MIGQDIPVLSGVLQTGEVGAGDSSRFRERLYPDLTIAAANNAAYLKRAERSLRPIWPNCPSVRFWVPTSDAYPEI